MRKNHHNQAENITLSTVLKSKPLICLVFWPFPVNGFAFPIDTWVYRVAKKLGCRSRHIEEIKECLIEKCIKSKVEPLKFAAGLWFLGFHSLDILLEDCLAMIEWK